MDKREAENVSNMSKSLLVPIGKTSPPRWYPIL
jgi:hypothetical protein